MSVFYNTKYTHFFLKLFCLYLIASLKFAIQNWAQLAHKNKMQNLANYKIVEL